MSTNLWRLTIDTNPEDCNASCIMCEEHSEHSDFIEELYKRTGRRRRRMPKEWIDQLFSQAKQLSVEEIIPSTMGEPLIYRHFEYILEQCAHHGILLNLTTNGTFPRKTIQEWAELIVPVTSDVKFSWNGATASTYESVMKGIRFENVLENLQKFVQYRDAHFLQTGHYCRISFQLTFMENNMHELGEIVRLAAEMGVDRVKGHHLWAHFNEIQDLNLRRNEESRKRWNDWVGEAYAAQELYRLANGKKVLLENIYPFEETKQNQQVPDDHLCPFLNRELWVSAEGKISPCCAPDELRQSLGDFGNITDQTLQEVLESDTYQQLVNNYQSQSLCQSCNMRKPL